MKVIIMTGVPGSGKSTTARQLELEGYKLVNQDVLGTRQKCLEAMEAWLIRRYNVVIDRTNINKQQRKYFIDLAKVYGVKDIESFVLQTPTDECIARIDVRKDHQTITEDMPLEKKREIVWKFEKDFELPSLDEGFSVITIKRG